MLIIYGGLYLGGIETFFLRLAKKSKERGEKIRFLILSHKSDSNEELVSKLSEYAEVYFFNDIFRNIPFLGTRFFLLNKFKDNKLSDLLDEVQVIHVTTGEHALLANRMLKINNTNIPITVGVYHNQQFCWKKPTIPYYEKVNRKYVFEYVSDSNILCFAKSTKEYLIKETSYPLTSAKTFRLGVVDKVMEKASNYKDFSSNKIKMCAVGRLVKFKTYNIWMTKVIESLREKNIDIIFDIYGEGPLESQIKNIINDSSVSLKGEFDYSNFDTKIKEYDLFIGSGTAIIQASSLGIPSIIGIESIEEPYTYGYFSEFYEYEYHSLDLDFPKVKVEELIENFLAMDKREKDCLSQKHILASESFNMNECYNNFINPNNKYVPLEKHMNVNLLRYYFSRVIFYFYSKLLNLDVYYQG